MGLPYVGYVRVSAVGGRGGDAFHSPAQQEQQIRMLASRLGVEVDILEPELNRSGGDDTRPILARAVQGVEQGRYAGILAAYLSRLARSTQMTLDVLRRVEAAGGKVITAQEGEAAGTPDGRFMTSIHAAVAQAERDRHVERFAELRAATVARGVWAQRQVPRGYRRGADRRLETDPASAEAVRAAFRRRASGEPLTQIARDLGMSTSGVRQMLANRVYLGELRSGGHVNAEAHEPIVTVAEWTQAQRTVRRGRNPTREPALLAGLARCSSCGRLMSRGASGQVRGGVYSCHATSPCPEHLAISLPRLDDYVDEVARAEMARVAADPGGDAERQRALSAAAQREEERLAQMIAALSDAGVSLAEASGPLREQRERRDAAVLARDEGASLAGLPVNVLALYDRSSATQRNRLLRGLLEAVVVFPAEGRPPASERVAVLPVGAGVVPARVGPPEVRRPPSPISRQDAWYVRLTGLLLHDLGSDTAD